MFDSTPGENQRAHSTTGLAKAIRIPLPKDALQSVVFFHHSDNG